MRYKRVIFIIQSARSFVWKVLKSDRFELIQALMPFSFQSRLQFGDRLRFFLSRWNTEFIENEISNSSTMIFVWNGFKILIHLKFNTYLSNMNCWIRLYIKSVCFWKNLKSPFEISFICKYTNKVISDMKYNTTKWKNTRFFFRVGKFFRI